MDVFNESSKYFNSPIQMWQFFDKYSRFDYPLNRRETWVESVDRSVRYLRELSGNKLEDELYQKIQNFVLNMKTLPSLRLLAMAGHAARRNNICIYNCAFLGIDNLKAFGESLLISMNGTGVGYSVEKYFTNQLPDIPNKVRKTDRVHTIEDSTEGWQAAIDDLFFSFYDGEMLSFDYSEIRPEGSILKTKGGRASGPDPLENTINLIYKKLKSYYIVDYENGLVLVEPSEKKLKSIDIHDAMCSIATASQLGGMRRAAMLCLFDLDDKSMREAKTGDWWAHKETSIRSAANNSAAWNGPIKPTEFLTHMADMFKNNNGEYGIFNRHGAIQHLPERRNPNFVFGINPCGEIILRNAQFCNLSAAIAREDDTIETLKEKVEIASIIGTIQASATHFPGLRPIWAKNCKEESLLGVDITGQRDCPLLSSTHSRVRSILADHAIKTNQIYAEKLGINQAAAVTCAKPSGNTSVLVDCSAGIHARPYRYYLRNVQVNINSPVTKALSDSGVPMSYLDSQNNLVHFPIKSPDSAIIEEDITAIDQLEFWADNKKYYTEHNPSATIKYKQEEIMEILNWLWENKEIIAGITFLPIVDAEYSYMPIERIDKETYDEKIKAFPEIDFSLIPKYETEDMTTAAQEVACSSGQCELV